MNTIICSINMILLIVVIIILLTRKPVHSEPYSEPTRNEYLDNQMEEAAVFARMV